MALGWPGVIEMVTTLIQYKRVIRAVLFIWCLRGFLKRYVRLPLEICILLNLQGELRQISHPFFRVVILCKSFDLWVQIEERFAADSRLARELRYLGHGRLLMSVEARVVCMSSIVLVRQIAALFLISVRWVALCREPLLLLLFQLYLVLIVFLRVILYIADEV